MFIHDEVEPINCALYCKGTLYIGDLHLGYEEAMNKKGIMLPRFQWTDMQKQFDLILDHLNSTKKPIETIVLVGDIKHEFGIISMQEWRETKKVFDYLKQHTQKLIIIKGNHDSALYPIAEKHGIQIVSFLFHNNILAIHGHEWTDDYESLKPELIIMGHEHPALGIRESGRNERIKCFMKCKIKKQILIVLPSFNPLIPGTDVLHGSFFSPLLKKAKSSCEIYGVLDNTIDPLFFGNLKDIEKIFK